MEAPEMIPAIEFCVHHNIEMSFIDSLNESGLIQTILVRESTYLPVDELPMLEKFIRFHYEMDINMEGIETISHLLAQISAMHEQVMHLTNKLRLYEGSQA